MSRIAFQILTLPFHITDDVIHYALFRRGESTGGYWQGIAGGGEDDETPIETARRESYEEAGIPTTSLYLPLGSMTTIPVVNVCGFRWGPDVLLLPEHAFGVKVENPQLVISHEHEEYRWLPIEGALEMVRFDSNRNALWELDWRLKNGDYQPHCLTTKPQ